MKTKKFTGRCRETCQAFSQDGEYGTQKEQVVFQLESVPDLSILSEVERNATKRAIDIIPLESGDDNTGGVKIVIKKPISPAAQSAIISAIPYDARDETKLKIALVNNELLKQQSPAEKGIKFSPLAQLTFILPDTEERVLVDSGSLYEAADWNDLGDDFLIKGFSIKEDAKTFEIEVKDGKVVHGKTVSYQIPISPDKGFAMDETNLAAWLEKEIRKSDGRYFPETLKKLVGKNIRVLMETGTTLAQLVRAKYVLAMSLKQWLNEHAGRVMKKTRQRMLFDNDDVRCEIEFSF